MAGKKRWFDGVSIFRLAIGAVGGFVLAGFAVETLTATPFGEVQRTEIAGELSAVDLVQRRNGRDLYLALAGRSERFHVVPADSLWGADVPEPLVEGAAVRLVVPKASLEHPGVSMIDGSRNVAVDGIFVGAEPVLSLAAAGQWDERNRRLAWWFLFLSTGVGLLCSTAVICRLRARRS